MTCSATTACTTYPAPAWPYTGTYCMAPVSVLATSNTGCPTMLPWMVCVHETLRVPRYAALDGVCARNAAQPACGLSKDDSAASAFQGAMIALGGRMRAWAMWPCCCGPLPCQLLLAGVRTGVPPADVACTGGGYCMHAVHQEWCSPQNRLYIPYVSVHDGRPHCTKGQPHCRSCHESAAAAWGWSCGYVACDGSDVAHSHHGFPGTLRTVQWGATGPLRLTPVLLNPVYTTALPPRMTAAPEAHVHLSGCRGCCRGLAAAQEHCLTPTARTHERARHTSSVPRGCLSAGRCAARPDKGALSSALPRFGRGAVWDKVMP